MWNATCRGAHNNRDLNLTVTKWMKKPQLAAKQGTLTHTFIPSTTRDSSTVCLTDRNARHGHCHGLLNRRVRNN
eukprot:6458363-Amphidinium_carterae.1